MKSSTLLHTSTIGFFDFLSINAMSLSSGVIPVVTSVIKTITSATSIARSACSLIWILITSFAFSSIPPVSIIVKSLPLQFVSPYTLSLVTPGVSSTIDSLCPTR